MRRMAGIRALYILRSVSGSVAERLRVLTVVGRVQMSTLSSQFQRQAEQNRHLRNRALGTEDTDLGTSALQHNLVHFTRHGGAWRIDDGGGRTPLGLGIAQGFEGVIGLPGL